MRHNAYKVVAIRIIKSQTILSLWLNGCIRQVAAAARDLRVDGTVLITVAAERLMSQSNEMRAIASEPRSRNMFVTPTLTS